MKKKRMSMVLLILCAMLLCPCMTVMAAGEQVVVSCDVLRGRSSAEILPDNIVTRFYQGEVLRKISAENGWVKVAHEGQEVYVSEPYVTLITEDDPVTHAVFDLDPDWQYAEYAKISSGTATVYLSKEEHRNGWTVCVNAGHGTSGGSSVKTQCHPDGTPKVTGGTTGAGATHAVAVSGGMTFADGTPEHQVTLQMALILKEELLARGYDVLMIRETADVQLDNVARTVMANNLADCHIALHWDSTTSDKGAFYMSVPNAASYRAMEPVASNWEKHHQLGEALIGGLRNAGVKIFSGGSMAMDLTQTSYSTIPSVDMELGDKVSDHSGAALEKLAGGLADGVDAYFAAVQSQ